MNFTSDKRHQYHAPIPGLGDMPDFDSTNKPGVDRQGPGRNTMRSGLSHTKVSYIGNAQDLVSSGPDAPQHNPAQRQAPPRSGVIDNAHPRQNIPGTRALGGTETPSITALLANKRAPQKPTSAWEKSSSLDKLLIGGGLILVAYHTFANRKPQ